MTKETLFKAGRKIIDQLEHHNYEGYFVGGAVRDYMLQRPVNDLDITTNALPDVIESLFDKTIDVGKAHGTIIVMMDDIPFEVTTYRLEGDYSDHRRPDAVYFTLHLKEDLSRRDFTINAMAMTQTMDLYDPYHGAADLKRQLITTVGQASERFNEDALRMLRAVRFMSQLDFTLSEETELAVKEHAGLLQHIAVERMTAELEKLYSGINTADAKNIIADSLLKYMPFFKYLSKDNYLNSVASSLEAEAVIQIYKARDLQRHLPELKLSNRSKTVIKQALNLLDELNEKIDAKLLAYRYETDIFQLVSDIIKDNSFLNEAGELLSEAAAVKVQLPIADRSALAVNGNSLMAALGLKGGPWLKDCLFAVERQVVLGKIKNNEAEIINWVKTHVKNENGNIIITDGK